jgi:ubiquinone/menaquinone biosynthesis C-methylase UbiE
MLQHVSGSVLDVPVGTGRFLQLYKDRGLAATGVDYNLSMLKHARAKDPEVPLEQGDVTQLRFPDGSFDVVVCVRLLHLIAPGEVPLVVKELLRVARCHVIATIHAHPTSCIKGRSQVHTRETLLACCPPEWALDCVWLMDEKGIGYYMAHLRRR